MAQPPCFGWEGLISSQMGFMQAKATLPHVQMSINSVLGCFEQYYPFVLFLKQLSLKLIDKCTSGRVAFPWVKPL